MKYKISDVYINVNGEDIVVGVTLGEEDKPSLHIEQNMLQIQSMKRG